MKTRHTLFLLCSFFFLLQAPAQKQTQPAEKQPEFPAPGTYSNSTLSYKIINSPNATYGYDILSNNKLVIHQPSIPGMAGNNGFKTKTGAEKVARLVISKINKGEMPPTVSIEEMKKLNALP